MKRYNSYAYAGNYEVEVYMEETSDGTYVRYADIYWKQNCKETPIPTELKDDCILFVVTTYNDYDVVDSIIKQKNTICCYLGCETYDTEEIVYWMEAPKIKKK